MEIKTQRMLVPSEYNNVYAVMGTMLYQPTGKALKDEEIEKLILAKAFDPLDEITITDKPFISIQPHVTLKKWVVVYFSTVTARLKEI